MFLLSPFLTKHIYTSYAHPGTEKQKRKKEREFYICRFYHSLKTAHPRCSVSENRMPLLRLDDSLDVARRHAARDARLFDLGPPVAGIVLDEHEALAFRHGVLCLRLRRVLVQRLDVLELLGATFWGHGGALFLAH